MKRTITCSDAPDSQADLWPAWKAIQLLEKRGVVSADEARRRQELIYEAMWWRGLEPDDLIDPAERLSGVSVVERDGLLTEHPQVSSQPFGPKTLGKP